MSAREAVRRISDYRLALVVFAVFLGVYCLAAYFVHQKIWFVSSSPYFTLLADALSRGRLDVLPAGWTHDLSFFDGRWYLYWGASPVLFVLPFYIVFGVSVSDAFYVFLAAALNAALFYCLLREVIKYWNAKISSFALAVLVCAFALASPNFYLALGGRVWHASQIISTLYLLLFVFLYFKFLNSGSRAALIGSMIFFNLAWVGRLTLLAYGLLFFLPARPGAKKAKEYSGKKIFYFILITGLSLLAFGAYNYLRFGHPLETGMKYQEGAGRYDIFIKSGEMFSPSHIGHNLKYYFLNFLIPDFRRFVLPVDPEGNSVFSVYPLLVLLPFCFFIRQFREKMKGPVFSFLAIATVTVGALMFFCGTGWVQFGNRYFFDAIPALFIPMVFCLDRFPRFIPVLLVFYGAVVNVWGAVVFYQNW